MKKKPGGYWLLRGVSLLLLLIAALVGAAHAQMTPVPPPPKIGSPLPPPKLAPAPPPPPLPVQAQAAAPAPTPAAAPFPPPFEPPQGTPRSWLEKAVTGSWYGETGPASAPTQRFITTRRADGSFTLELRTYTPGKPTLTISNSGVWSISNGLFLTVVTRVNGRPVNAREAIFTSAYAVRSISGNEFQYQHVLTGTELKVVRVFPDFRLPD